MSNPFPTIPSAPGDGKVHLALLPPATPALRTLTYQYPLKLISPAALRSASNHLIHTIYVLTYGGGLVAGDSIQLDINVDSTTRLILLTQGSTKVFKSPSGDVISRQSMSVKFSQQAALCYLPDPVQPFENSCFEQKQIYDVVLPANDSNATCSLCVLDWVCEGRSARGESWSFTRYGSRNEIYLAHADGSRRLLLRDNILLNASAADDANLAGRMDSLGVFGTLMLYGPLNEQLGRYFMDEFRILSRIGGRKWDSGSESGDDDVDPAQVRRLRRQAMEKEDGLLWTAASVRGCVVVKFGAREVEGGKKWLRWMLKEEGTVVREFGERALLCL